MQKHKCAQCIYTSGSTDDYICTESNTEPVHFNKCSVFPFLDVDITCTQCTSFIYGVAHRPFLRAPAGGAPYVLKLACELLSVHYQNKVSHVPTHMHKKWRKYRNMLQYRTDNNRIKG